jgi:hypothetical protein
MTETNVFSGGWIASLSNGETVYETNPEEGKPTPWQALLQKCEDEDIKITMIRLQYGPFMIQAMPEPMCDGYFQAREVQQIVYRNTMRYLQGIGSVVGDQVFITWAEFTNDRQIYVSSDVRPLESCKIHTTVK